MFALTKQKNYYDGKKIVWSKQLEQLAIKDNVLEE
jgi:hypothetical protein